MLIRERIKELRRVSANELIPNPRNWRTHPDMQKDVLRGILAEIGYSDALLADETSEGLQLIDGHARTEISSGGILPVLVLDVSQDEADKLLASLDPFGLIAGADAIMVRKLLAGPERPKSKRVCLAQCNRPGGVEIRIGPTEIKWVCSRQPTSGRWNVIVGYSLGSTGSLSRASTPKTHS